MNINFYTLGCKLNQCETESLASFFKSRGFSIVSSQDSQAKDEETDLFIINTCTVTSKSEQKARRVIRNFLKKHPMALVIVTGCYAQLAHLELSAMSSHLLVIPQEEKDKLFDFAEKIRTTPGFSKMNTSEKKQLYMEATGTAPGKKENNQNCSCETNGNESTGTLPGSFKFDVDTYQFHSRAFLKIQDGCDYRCTYCRVPLARGNSISLDPEVIYSRAHRLEESGYREIVLTGVNICSYKYGKIRLPDLLKQLLNKLANIRIRLSSLEPEKIDETLTAVLKHERICPHFHIPIQSGSDKILRGMKRRYNAARIVTAMKLLEKVKPEAFFSGDVITGFPGETDEDFLLTKRLIESLGFSGLHVFQYSPRPGTAAYDLPDKVPERTRKERARELQKTAAIAFENYVRKFKGKTLTVVLEKKMEEDAWKGVSENYLKLLIRNIPTIAKKGAMVRAEIQEPGDMSLSKFVSFVR